MQKLVGFILIAAMCSLSACKGHTKKIIVYATGNIQVDAGQTNIIVGEGTAQEEKDLVFTSGSPVTLNVQTAAGKTTLQVPEDGLYIANLKSDTLIGSFQRVGADNGGATISQEALKQKLDSLQQLVNNQNVNAANKNYFIVPNSIGRITSETNAKIFGPFTTIPGGFDAGSVPEIYKFYSAREIREIIGKLGAMTGDKKPEEGDKKAAEKK